MSLLWWTVLTGTGVAVGPPPVTAALELYLDPPQYVDAVLDDGALAYYRMTGVLDHTEHGYSATPANVTFGQTGALADGDEAALFNGDTSAFWALFDGLTTRTFEGWFKTTVDSGAFFSRLFAWSNNEFQLALDHDNRLWLAAFKPAVSYMQIWRDTGLTITSAEGYVHLAVTWDGTWFRVYKNGALGFSVNAGGAGLALTAGTFYISPGSAISIDASPSVVPDPVVAAGTNLAIAWANIAAPAPGDWVGLWVLGTSGATFIDWFYLNGTKVAGAHSGTNGTMNFLVPGGAVAGTYEVRLFTADTASMLCWSTTVITPSATLTASPNYVDEVALYDSALTATQIANHYALRLSEVPGWYNVITDTRTQIPIVCEYGIQGSTPSDLVASTGSLRWALDNSAGNSGGVVGYYSPLHAAKRQGFTFNVPVRFKLTSGVVRYKFRGSLAEILPTPGVHEDRLTHCVALDWMDDAARLDLPDLPAQLNKRPDELVTTILDALPLADQPVARTIETGAETYNIALDGGATGTLPKVREVLNQIAASERGYVYLKGDADTGSVFTFEGRHHRAANPTVRLTLDETNILRSGIVVPGSRDDIYSRVQVFVRPTRVDVAATTVLHSLQTTSTLIPAGATNDTIFGPYRDPVNNDQIGGTETVDPVATTDYTMNASADGSGADLTANFVVVASRTGLGVRYSITNNGTTAGYVTKLQVRGKGIYRYSAMVEVDVPSGYGTRILTVDMPYQNSTNVAADVATYLAGLLSVPFAHVPSVRFHANHSAAFMEAAIVREPGDRIALSESVTGVNSEFTINSVRLELQAPDTLWCTWGLEPASSQRFWLLGVLGASELGETTFLGF